jgi:hypothetical protein
VGVQIVFFVARCTTIPISISVAGHDPSDSTVCTKIPSLDILCLDIWSTYKIVGFAT